MTYTADHMGKLLVAVCLRCVKNSLNHNFKPQHVVDLPHFLRLKVGQVQNHE